MERERTCYRDTESLSNCTVYLYFAIVSLCDICTVQLLRYVEETHEHKFGIAWWERVQYDRVGTMVAGMQWRLWGWAGNADKIVEHVIFYMQCMARKFTKCRVTTYLAKWKSCDSKRVKQMSWN